MRDPYLINEVICEYDKSKIIKIDNIPLFDIPDYDLLDDKDFEKYLSNIEKVVRTSFEYREMVKYLRENLNMNACSFYENVTNENSYKIKIHIHHHPFTLYDIVRIVYSKRVAFEEDLNINMVAKEVMYLHYSMLVGLIPLSQTAHELVHGNYLFIPLDRVMGIYDNFVNLYHDFIPVEVMDIYERNKEFNKEYNHNTFNNNHILDKNLVYLDMSECYKLPDLKEVLSMMENKVKEIDERRNACKLKRIMERI